MTAFPAQPPDPAQELARLHEENARLRAKLAATSTSGSDSDRKLAGIFRASPEVIIVSRLSDGCFIEVNDAFLQILGYSYAETIGHTSLDLGLWPTPAERNRLLAEVAEHGRVRNRETVFLRKSREALSVLLSASDILLDGERCMIWLFSDITGLKRAEHALRASEKRFARLLQNSNDIIAIIDRTGRPLTVVGPFVSVLGYTLADASLFGGFRMVHPDDTARTRETFGRMLASPGTPIRVEYRLRHRAGHWVPVEVVGTNWLHEPEIGGVVLNLREVTERKNAERLQAQLQQAQKMETVGRLAGGVAHDFNNLLTVISGNIELARLDLGSPALLAEYLAEIARAAENAAALIRRLLAFSRRQIVDPRPTCLNELLDNMHKMLARVIGENIALQSALAPDLDLVKVDPGQFEQVVVNLAVNARDAMPDGGRLILETANVELEAEHCRLHPGLPPGAYVMLSISDTGHGMTDEVKAHLFEPFFTTKAPGRGTGLGLAMIFGAVTQAGGTIEVTSEVGAGTSFRIYLPRVAGPRDAPPPGTTATPLRGGSETILLVEDEPSVRLLITGFLRRQGYAVLTAANGTEALGIAAAHTGPIALLFTDIVMPGMNGRELAERLHVQRPDTTLLFTSGYTDDAVVLHAVSDDRFPFIGKPYSLHLVADRIRELLDARAG